MGLSPIMVTMIFEVVLDVCAQGVKLMRQLTPVRWP